MFITSIKCLLILYVSRKHEINHYANKVQFYQSLDNTIGRTVISAMSYKGAILQRNYRKMVISWSFSDNSFIKLHGKKIGSHNMTVLYPNLC